MHYICSVIELNHALAYTEKTPFDMKETVHVNLGSEAFTIDQDAYQVLRSYFNDIRSRLPEQDSETMADIETRMAEIFREKVTSSMRVVTLEMVRSAMNRMGSPAEFGERRKDGIATEPAQTAAPEADKLYRSRNNRSIAGICGGIGEFFNIDPTLLRMITLLLIFFGGLSLWVYIILWIVIPEAPAKTINIHKNTR